MDLTPWLPRLPLIAGLLQLPWFVMLSIARVRAGGTSALPLVKLIDLLIPLPALAGLLLAAWLLWGGAHGGGWMFWTGGAVCALMCAGFAAVLLS